MSSPPSGSHRFGTAAGIGIYVHWTFWVLLAAFFVFYLWSGLGLVRVLGGLTIIVLLFGCVVLHELGHALMARRFGIPTVDITMYPMGGVARLERMPKEPKQELLVAIAGPAVNLVIAVALYVINVGLGNPVGFGAVFRMPLNMLGVLMWMNVALALFNMLPAFPMDGGRVLRASLAANMGHQRATMLAAGVGQAFAVLFVLSGLVSLNPILVFIGLFVFAGARQEAAHAS